MFIDARSLADGESLEADLCIVGTGAAGLSLLHGLAQAGLTQAGLRVILVESGGPRPDSADQDLNAGTSDRSDYPFQPSRARAFGGTTTRWTGACIPLDPVDFQPRPWLAHSGWPISHAELAPHYARATAIFGLPERLPEGLAGPEAAGPLGSGQLAQKPVLFSRPLDLGKRFRRQVQASREIAALLHATVTELVTDAGGQTVRHARLALPQGKTARVTARFFVLAAGGIETPRLLLNSRGSHAAGLGNAHDVVGRYHMEHPIRCLATVALETGSAAVRPFTNRRTFGGASSEQTFGLSAAVRGQEQLLDMHVRVYRYAAIEAHPAVIAGKALARSATLRGAAAYLGRHARHLPGAIAPYLGWHALNKVWAGAPFRMLRLTAFLEQEPDPDNRITLSATRDRFGVPLPHLTLRESALMQDSVARSLQIMARDLQQRGVGRMAFGPDEVRHLAQYDKYGFHHMGGTRMSDDPRRGVVDRNLRVHGIANLYVSGSSVFCTGGAANPTLTIAALSLRLADHLQERLQHR